MKSTMNTSDLLSLLEKNKVTHVAEFKEAWEGFLDTVKSETSAFLDTVTKGGTPKNWTLSWLVPKSFEDDYDNAIAMVKHHVLGTIELEDEEYERLVLDKWHWKQHFTTTSAMYAKKK